MAQIFVVNYAMCDTMGSSANQSTDFVQNRAGSLSQLSHHNLQLFTPQFTRRNPPNQTSSPLQPSMQTYNKLFSTFQCTIFVFNVLIVCSRFLGGIQQISDNCKLFKKNLPSVGHLCLFDCNALWLHAMYVVC